jgi:hypothetical protein
MWLIKFAHYQLVKCKGLLQSKMSTVELISTQFIHRSADGKNPTSYYEGKSTEFESWSREKQFWQPQGDYACTPPISPAKFCDILKYTMTTFFYDLFKSVIMIIIIQFS